MNASLLDNHESFVMPDSPAEQCAGHSARSQVALLSRLLSDSHLRQQFYEDRERVAVELADDDADATFLLTIDPVQLEAQAETLISKRQHEVAQLLPLTWKQLGHDAADLFRAYAAESAWPEGHTRHLLDAVEFGLWLSRRSQHKPVGLEWNRTRFAASDGDLAAHFVHERPMRFGLQILFRQRSGQIRQLVLRLSLPQWR